MKELKLTHINYLRLNIVQGKIKSLNIRHIERRDCNRALFNQFSRHISD